VLNRPLQPAVKAEHGLPAAATMTTHRQGSERRDRTRRMPLEHFIVQNGASR
jgi:hypothetical protein